MQPDDKTAVLAKLDRMMGAIVLAIDKMGPAYRRSYSELYSAAMCHLQHCKRAINSLPKPDGRLSHRVSLETSPARPTPETNRNRASQPTGLQELKLVVPTYNARCFANEVERGEKQEFGEPFVHVLVREADGVRIVLGSHDFSDNDKPDIQIERQPNGWAIFLHPVGGGDPCGYAYFLDDGRSFLVKESCHVTTPPIHVLAPDERVPELDGEI